MTQLLILLAVIILYDRLGDRRRRRIADRAGRIGLPPGHDHRVCAQCGLPRSQFLSDFPRSTQSCFGRDDDGCSIVGVTWS